MTDKTGIVLTLILLGLWTGFPARAADAIGSASPQEAVPVRPTAAASPPAPLIPARKSPAIWTTPAGLTVKGRALAIGLLEAGKEGLDPQDYLSPTFLERCLDDTLEDADWCESQLNEAYLHYAEDVGYGRYHTEEQDPEWHIPARTFDARSALSQAQSTDDIANLLRSLPPPHPQYRRLREALAAYRSMAATGAWPVIPEGPTLEGGEDDSRVGLLRSRLAAEGYPVPATANGDRYDETVLEAVRDFQSRHGLAVDGKVGPRTRAALNTPLNYRIAQIRLNMERWRWLPRDLGERYLLVNLPAFELEMRDNGQLVHRMRAITGRIDRTSPSFASRLTQIVLHPSWTVPRRLAVEDLLPRQQEDPDFLDKKQITVLQKQGDRLVEIDAHTVDWTLYDKDNFPFVLRQAPGPRNSLGKIKFIMPNPFQIFLHDTPGKALFNKTIRTFSSGCIRLQDPLLLADWLVSGEDPGIIDSLQRELDGDDSETLALPLRGRVQVYLVYLTVWVDEAGNVQFRDDIYARNHILLSMFRD